MPLSPHSQSEEMSLREKLCYWTEEAKKYAHGTKEHILIVFLMKCISDKIEAENALKPQAEELVNKPADDESAIVPETTMESVLKAVKFLFRFMLEVP